MKCAMSGAILENFVLSEIVKSHQNCGWEAYYRDKDTKEIDILLEDSSKLYPMEIKKTATPQKQLTCVAPLEWTYTNKVDTFRNIYYTLVNTFWRCIYGFKINSL